MRYTFCLLIALIITGTAAAQVAHVETRDGSAHRGEVTGMFKSVLRLKTAGGTADIAWSAIDILTTEENLAVAFGEGEKIQVRLVGVEADKVVVSSPHLGVLKLVLASLPDAPQVKTPEEKAAEGPLEPKDWSGSVNLAGSVTAGNSEALLVALDALAARQWSRDRVEFVLRLVYGETQGRESANSQAFRARYEHHYSEHLYVYAQGEVFRDKIQDITLGLLIDAGVGYVLWKDSDKEMLALEGGVGYRHESYEDNTDARNDITGRGAVVFRDILFDTVELTSLAEMIVPLNDPNGWLGRLELGWQVPVSDNWSFSNSIRLSYRNEPAEDRKKLDVFVGAGLNYSF